MHTVLKGHHAPTPTRDPRQRFVLARKDPKVRNLLVEENVRLVYPIARSYARGSIPFEDLVQEGNIGLMKAVEKFDPDRGFRFSTYASFWIRNAILKALQEKGRTIRLPRNAIEQVMATSRAHDELSGELGRGPTTKEIAGRLEWTGEKVRDTHNFPSAGSFDALEDFEPVEIGEDDADLDHLYPLLHDALSKLPERHRSIIEDRYGLAGRESKTLKAIGGEQGCSPERISRLQKRAEARLKEIIETSLREGSYAGARR